MATGVDWQPSGSSNGGARSSRWWPEPPVTSRVSKLGASARGWGKQID
jgi:hypothetical protein